MATSEPNSVPITAADVEAVGWELAVLSVAARPEDAGSDGAGDWDSTASDDNADPDKNSDPATKNRRRRKKKGKAAPVELRFPQRPGEPNCAFFVKNGACRYGANCRFNHPPGQKGDQVKSKDVVETSEVKPKDVADTNQAGKLDVSPSESVEPTEGEVIKEKKEKEIPLGKVKYTERKKDEKGKECYPEKSGQIQFKKDQKEKEAENFPERAGQAQCKYYSTPVGCKYGKYCKFLHGEEKTEISPMKLNFLGLPIRPGEKNCPYYMRTGGCKYASNCKYHHPDPVAVGGQDSHSAYQNSASPNLHAPSLPSVSWPLQSSNETVPFYDSAPAYIPGMFLPPQGHYPNPQWNGYQAPLYPLYPMEMGTGHPSVLPMNDSTREADGPVHQNAQFDEYPARPGQKECQYFMKTGDCKFKSACKFHHPKSRSKKASGTTHSGGFVA